MGCLAVQRRTTGMLGITESRRSVDRSKGSRRMSAISRPAYRPRNRTKEFIIAVRSGGNHLGRGTFTCGHCGAGGMSMADFADENGLSTRDVSRFLNRLPVRDDVATRIRANVMRVVE